MNQIQPKMKALRLHGMSVRWQALVETRKLHELSLIEGLELLLESEEEYRDNNRFQRLEKQAKFRYKASIEQLKYDGKRGLNKDQVTTLITAGYIKKGQAVLITGSTGCGKSFLASALGHHACMQGYKVLYFNLKKLMTQIKMARIDGSVIKIFDKISKTDLLIIDDFGLIKFDKNQQLDFLEIIEDRHAKAATIIASQLPVSQWYNSIGEATIADAILDRIIHTSHRIELDGDSLRKNM